jgi:hypothetical protein
MISRFSFHQKPGQSRAGETTKESMHETNHFGVDRWPAGSFDK